MYNDMFFCVCVENAYNIILIWFKFGWKILILMINNLPTTTNMVKPMVYYAVTRVMLLMIE
jgi:hypothetical protein